MKKFEAPVIEIEKFDVEDVVTTSSSVIDPSNPNQLPLG